MYVPWERTLQMQGGRTSLRAKDTRRKVWDRGQQGQKGGRRGRIRIGYESITAALNLYSTVAETGSKYPGHAQGITTGVSRHDLI